jgi:hypothetical protein
MRGKGGLSTPRPRSKAGLLGALLSRTPERSGTSIAARSILVCALPAARGMPRTVCEVSPSLPARVLALLTRGLTKPGNSGGLWRG